MLDGSSYAWLGEVLAAFNAGDLHRYDALCARHAAALNSQPALVENQRALREKITILALTELIFKWASTRLHARQVSATSAATQWASSPAWLPRQHMRVVRAGDRWRVRQCWIWHGKRVWRHGLADDTCTL